MVRNGDFFLFLGTNAKSNHTCNMLSSSTTAAFESLQASKTFRVITYVVYTSCRVYIYPWTFSFRKLLKIIVFPIVHLISLDRGETMAKHDLKFWDGRGKSAVDLQINIASV